MDDYKTNDIGALMFRMRVREAENIDNELIKKIEEATVDIEKSSAVSLEDFSNKLEKIDKEFWLDGSCKLNVRVNTVLSEAIIDLGENFKFRPSIKKIT